MWPNDTAERTDPKHFYRCDSGRSVNIWVNNTTSTRIKNNGRRNLNSNNCINNISTKSRYGNSNTRVTT